MGVSEIPGFPAVPGETQTEYMARYNAVQSAEAHNRQKNLMMIAIAVVVIFAVSRSKK